MSVQTNRGQFSTAKSHDASNLVFFFLKKKKKAFFLSVAGELEYSLPVLLLSFNRVLSLTLKNRRSHDTLAPAISWRPPSEQITTSTPPTPLPSTNKAQATEPRCLCF